MPKAPRRITDSLARSLPAPPSGYTLHWCPSTPGLGVRVSVTGDRAWVLERRVNGKTVRRTLGKAAGAGAISADTARRLQLQISSELQSGVDRAREIRAARRAEREAGVTFAQALEAYVTGKRRGKDGLPLKERTKHDYLAMVAPPGTTKRGKPTLEGPLHPLADRPVAKLTADEIRELHGALLERGPRQASYALQVLRAVLNWHGVRIENSPLDRTTAGRDRIVLAPTVGRPRPIPPEKLATWWQAATAREGSAAADGCRFILLTGCRPGEVFGSAFAPGLRVRDVDLEGGRVELVDTKNRQPHVVMLSTQAREILARHCKGKKRGARVFDVEDPGKTLEAINAEVGVAGITPHKLRHTFGSVAEELVSGYALKRMLNHALGGDVTGAHYVGKSETQLRLAWQTVADFITSGQSQ